MEQLGPRQLHEMMGRGEPICLVDVRQPWEHDLVHLPGDVLLPLAELEQLEDLADELSPPAGALVVTYCHHGIRSLNGAAMLQQLGHARVASLAGGIDRWAIEIDPSLPRY
jgi:rhodanese-related sulfurtransferase